MYLLGYLAFIKTFRIFNMFNMAAFQESLHVSTDCIDLAYVMSIFCPLDRRIGNTPKFTGNSFYVKMSFCCIFFKAFR